MSFKIRGRFSDDKQDQIEQLIGYATMLGLSGTDLVSIGSKMDREKKKVAKLHNVELIKNFNILSAVSKGNTLDINQVFRLKTENGTYEFKHDWSDQWTIKSLKTRLSRTVNISLDYELPRSSWIVRSRNCLLVEIALGIIVLNF